jgi:hypothetical protein
MEHKCHGSEVFALFFWRGIAVRFIALANWLGSPRAFWGHRQIIYPGAPLGPLMQR